MPAPDFQAPCAARDVVVFRQNLFRVSEPFVTQQAQQLRRYRPTYMGRLRFGAAPDGARSLCLRDDPAWRALPRIAWQVASRSPAAYLRLLGGLRPSLIHAHFGTDGVYALPLARRLGIPLVTTFHGFDATLSTAALLTSPAWANFVLFRRRLAVQGELFLCVSSFIRDRVLAMGFPPARTRLHYTGIDVRAVQVREPREETPTILHVGRLVEMKGTRILIEAFARLAQSHPGVRLEIVGDGPLRRSLQALAASTGAGERIAFLGALRHARVLDQVRRAAMLVLPSVLTATGRVEGLGMVLLEAAATGVPVVASQIGGIPEGMIGGHTGLLVPPRDAHALASAIGRLLDDPAARLAMGKAGRAFVQARFDSARQGALLEGLYDSVMPHGTDPS